MLLLLEFDFTVIICKGSNDVLVDHLSRVPNGEPTTCVEDDLLDALFLGLAWEWAAKISHFLANGFPQDMPLNEGRSHQLLKDATPYQLIASQLYKLGKDGILHSCVRENEFMDVLESTHSRMVWGHFATKTIAYKVL